MSNKPIKIKFISDSEPKIFDQSNIQQFNEEDRKEILEDFLKYIGEKIAKIQNNDNIEEIKIVIHSLRSSSGNIGAEKLWKYTKQIDESLEEDDLLNKNWKKELLSIYQEFEIEVRLFMDEM